MWEFAGDAGGGGMHPGPFPEPRAVPLYALEPWAMVDAVPPLRAAKLIDPFPGNPGEGGELSWLPENACQLKECDNTRMQDLEDALNAAPDGIGFKAALDPVIDWQRYHEFQCLGWILWTGDDALRNTNNNLIIERDDGKLVWAPYSIDISAGQGWYLNTPLTGVSRIAQGCQRDTECWADTIEACETLITNFDALDPEKFVDETVATLTGLGMLREGDEERAAALRTWYVERQLALTDELEKYRYLPGPDGCPNDLMECNDGTCGTPEQCDERRCEAGALWCESTQSCLMNGEECVTCDEATPFYCAPTAACEASYDACSAACDAQSPGWIYCPPWGSCAPEHECLWDRPDGGDKEDAAVDPDAAF